MVENFLAGGAAVSVLARQHGIGLTLGLDLDSVLEKDPTEWSFSQALGAFID